MDLIVAVDQNWAIGKDGEQLLYLSQDLKRFKALTLGHAVILGRRTLSTFPGAPFWTGAAPPMSLRSWPSTPQTGTSRTWMPTLAGSRWRSQNSWRRTEYASGM